MSPLVKPSFRSQANAMRGGCSGCSGMNWVRCGTLNELYSAFRSADETSEKDTMTQAPAR